MSALEQEYSYPNIIKVHRLGDETEVNEYLDLGWVLLTVLTVERTKPPTQIVVYVLGWDKTNGEIKEPEQPDDISEENLPF